MKRWTSPGCAAILVLGCGLLAAPAQTQDDSAKAVLLGRARTLEQRGRLDLAAGDWVQVLMSDPNDAEALAGLVRAARALGRTAEAETYLARLRAAHPRDPEVARLEAGGGGGARRDQAAELAEASRLARVGDDRGAMVLYRRVYGLNPPPGEPALAYFETEAGTEDGRAHAVAGLRALADRYPADARYQVALGRVLLGNPRTRAEGRALLERYPRDPEAVAALLKGNGERGGTAVAAARPGGAGGVAAAKRLPEVASAVAPGGSKAVAREAGRPGAGMQVSAPRAVAGATRRPGFAAEEQAGFDALNAHRTGEAERQFRGILARDPRDARALAGMGYLRLLNDDFKGAMNYFVSAQEDGDRSLALTRALVNTQFEMGLQRAETARERGDLTGAEAQFREAVRERPADPEALEGLGATLLQGGRAGAAIPVFTKLTQVRPLSPAAWRGLVLAEAEAGHSGQAVAMEAREPAPVREPLGNDPIYVDALRRARAAAAGNGGAVEVAGGAGVVNTGRMTVIGGGAAAEAPAAVAPVAPKAVATGVAEASAGRVALQQGENARAAGMFRAAIAAQPGNADAWQGLVLALYAAGDEGGALAALDEAPAHVLAQLELDATFQAAAGFVYLKAERPGEGLRALVRAQNVFVAQKLPPPVGLVLRVAALLAARGDDANLYRELMYLGGRRDLSTGERREVQTVWAGWAVRRARAMAAAGEPARAVVLLNAAAGSFAGNPEVVSAVADGYAGVGLPREATALYKALDLAQSPAVELERAIRAGIKARDFRAAEGWLRLGRDRFPSDPEMLTLAAEMEQARGHEERAVELSQRAKAMAAPQNPEAVLRAELREARAGYGWRRGGEGQLATLLAPSEGLSLATGGEGAQPYLPAAGDRAVEAQTPVLAGYDEPSN